MKKFIRIISILVIVFMLASSAVAAPKNTNSNTQVKNIILLISDGMGFNTMLAADYYQYGKTGKQVYQNFPVHVAVATYEYEYATWDDTGKPLTFEIFGYSTEDMWSNFGYAIETNVLSPAYINNATDSASSATAMATGVITKDGSIGVDIFGNPHKNIVEIAKEQGKSAGVVSSVPFSHATSASFVAHNPSRSDTVGIAQEMILRSDVDVIMGCGAPDYNHDGVAVDISTLAARAFNYVGGKDLWNVIASGTVDVPGKESWTVIRDRSKFQALANGPTPKRVLGVPRVNETLQYYRTPIFSRADAYTEPFIETVPTLAEMTSAALNVLNNNENGFFLMVEGGAVDWAAHFWQPGRLIEEQIDFNYAVEAAVEWVEKNSNWGETLLIVCADHETGYIWGPGSGEPDDPWPWKPVVNNGAGNMPDFNFYSNIGGFSWHSNTLVPLFAKGNAAKLFKGYATNTDLVYGAYLHHIDTFKIMKECFTAEQIGNKPAVPPGQDKKNNPDPEKPGNRPIIPPGQDKKLAI